MLSSWKDPDSLLVIQALLRIGLLLFPVGFALVSGIRLGFGSVASAALFLGSYTVRVWLYSVEEYRMEGPMGGKICLAFDGFCAAAAAVQIFLAISLMPAATHARGMTWR